MNRFYFIMLLVMISLPSCASRYVYFTESLREQQQWTESDLRQIQFYVSRDIVLTRAIGTGETRIEGGKVIVRDGRQLERVFLPAFTPGVLVMIPNTQRLAISFEAGGPESFLMFGPNAGNSHRYSLLAQTWYPDRGEVNYQGRLYDADALCTRASLLVDLRRIAPGPAKTRTVRGRKLE